MKVKELIERLSELDPELEVRLDGILDVTKVGYIGIVREKGIQEYNDSVGFTWGPRVKREPYEAYVVISQ